MKESLAKNKFPDASRMSVGRCAVPSGGKGEEIALLHVAPQLLEIFCGAQPCTSEFLPPMESKAPWLSSGTITEWRPPVRPPMSCQSSPLSELRHKKLVASEPSMAK